MHLKVFAIHYKGVLAPKCRSDCFEPFIADDDPCWAELTAHEHILKEYLPQFTNEKFLGFCHYRRFPDFWRKRPSKFLPHIGFKKFAEDFSSKYAEKNILSVIDGYDVVVPCPCRWGYGVKSNLQQYLISGHPPRELDRLIEIIRCDYPQMVEDLDLYLNGRKAYLWLQFIMRRDWFKEFLVWEFEILKKLEKSFNWQSKEYHTYARRRVPAFLAERFFNVFLNHKMRTCRGKLLERQCLFLGPDEELGLVNEMKRYSNFLLEKSMFLLKKCTNSGI